MALPASLRSCGFVVPVCPRAPKFRRVGFFNSSNVSPLQGFPAYKSAALQASPLYISISLWPALSEIRCRKSARCKNHVFTRIRCSLEAASATDEPSSSGNDRRSPNLKWIIAAAGVFAAGVIIYVKFRTAGITSVVSDQGAVLQGSTEASASFDVKLPGFNLSLGERTPGWVYFALLMAAGFGLFVSEEALNVWVGGSLARCLSYGTREAFFTSLSANSAYIVSTILWVYWGVCISDMVPFYAGKFASRTGDQVREKLGVSKEKYSEVTANVQRYGNLIGFVERFSVGVRNPTAFLAGVAGISPLKFFVGVCCGGLFTLPIQMSIGFLLRKNPVAALAGVAAVVGAWTVFPYAAAGIVSLYYLLTRRTKKSA